MPDNPYIAFTANYRNYSLILYIFILSLWACNNYSSRDSHPEYFDKILRIVDTTSRDKKDQAFALLDSAYNAFPDPGIGDLFAKDSIKCDQYSFANHDYIKALSYADSMILIAKERLDNEIYAERYAWALFAKGDCFLRMNRSDECLQYYTDAQQVTLKYVKNKCNIARFDQGMGNMMFNQQKYRQAAGYFIKQNEDLNLNCKANDYKYLMGRQSSINNASISYYRAGILDSTAYFANKALQIISKEENNFPDKLANTIYAKAVVYAGLADVMIQKKEFSDAEKTCKKCIADAGYFDISFRQAMLGRLASTYLDEMKTEPAGATLSQLKNLIDSFPNEVQLSKWYDLKVKYFKQNGKIDSAFEYLQNLDELKDSIQAREKKFDNEDISKKFENLELKYSNEVLQKEGKLKSLYLIVSVLIFILVSSIAVFIWYNLNLTKKQNLQIAKKNDELEKAFHSLEQSYAENIRIMTIVAHDLKNPINAIQNIMYSLMAKEQSPQQKEAFKTIQTSSLNMTALINDLLEEKKEKTESNKERANMADLLEYSVQLLQATADEKKQKLKLETEEAFVIVDRQKIWRVITNIVSNAIKFSPRNSVINIKLQENNSFAWLSVKDNGIGIPSTMQDKILNAPSEILRHGTQGEKPHGLGLMISKQIIEEYNGKIWFESEEGEGTTFYIELPLAS